MNSQKWSEEEIDFVKKNRFEMSYSEMGKKLGRTRNAVMVKLNKMGLKLEKKYSANFGFFDTIDSEEKAYWLGFIFADGFIEQFGFGIHLKGSDIGHLKKLNKSIDGNFAIKTFSKRLEITDKEYQMCSIRIYSKHLADRLIELGATRKKSLTIIFPSDIIVPDELLRHFLRGFFDGDGSISVDKRKMQLRCKFSCASIDFVKSLCKIFTEMKLSFNVPPRRPNNKVYDINITGKRSNKVLLEYIYGNCEIYLDRKYFFYKNNEHLLTYLYEGWNKRNASLYGNV